MKCALPGCGEVIKNERHPFCPSHYQQLLAPARKALQYAFRGRIGDTEGSSELRWKEAVEKAVKELQRPPAWC